MKRSYGRSLPLATCGDPMMTVRAAASFRHAVKSAAGRRAGGPIRAGQRVSGGPRRRHRTPRHPVGGRPGHPRLTGYRTACRTGRRAGRPTGRQLVRPAMPRSGRPRGWSAETMDGRGKGSRKTNASGPSDDTRSGPPARLITPTAPGGGAERGAVAARSLPGSAASGASWPFGAAGVSPRLRRAALPTELVALDTGRRHPPAPVGPPVAGHQVADRPRPACRPVPVRRIPGRAGGEGACPSVR